MRFAVKFLIPFVFVSLTFSCKIGSDIRDGFEAVVCPTNVALRDALKNIELQVYQSPATIENNISSKGNSFELEGLIDLANQDQEVLNILLVHGMRSKSFDHFFPLINEIAGELGFNKWERKRRVRIEMVGLNDKPKNKGLNPRKSEKLGIRDTLVYIRPLDNSFHEANLRNSIYLIEYYKRAKETTTSSDKEVQKLRFYNVHWSPIMDSVKGRLYTLDKDPGRTKIAEHIKNQYFIELFGDQALYQGNKFEKEIIHTALESMRLIQAREPFSWLDSDEWKKNLVIDSIDLDKSSPVAFISGSLGSKIILDALSSSYTDLDTLIDIDVGNKVESLKPIAKRSQVILENFRNRLSHIFMLSNQLPFYVLDNIRSDTIYSKEMLDSLIHKNFKPFIREKTQNPIQIVSFYDPNDVFGYKLPPSKDLLLNFSNIKLHNTLRWSINPISSRNYLNNTFNISKNNTEINELLDQNYSRQELLLNLDKPNEGIINKENSYGNYKSNQMSKILVHGGSYFKKEGNKSKKLLVEFPNNGPRYKVKSKYPRIIIQKGESQVKKYFTDLVTNSLAKKAKRLSIKSAQLPYELINKEVEFNGIKEYLPLLSDKKDTIHIVSIHGMTHKPPEQYTSVAKMMAEMLEFYPTPTKDVFHVFGELPKFYLEKPFYGVRIQEFKNLDGQVMRFYMMYWSTLTKPAKNWLKYVDSLSYTRKDLIKDTSQLLSSTGMGDRRAIFHQKIKTDLILDGFVDVIMGINGYHKELINLVDQTIKLTYLKNPFHPRSASQVKEMIKLGNPIPSSEQPIFILSGSLGSDVMFDWLSNSKELIPFPGPYIDSALHRIKKVFFFSDQASLIGLRKLANFKDQSSYEQDILEDLLATLKSSGKKDALEIIAFYDPNDIMNYKIPDSLAKSDSLLKVQNVQLNIAPGITVRKKFLYRYSRKLDRKLRKLVHNRSKKTIRDQKRKGSLSSNEKPLFRKKDFRPIRRYYRIQKKSIADSLFFVKSGITFLKLLNGQSLETIKAKHDSMLNKQEKLYTLKSIGLAIEELKEIKNLETNEYIGKLRSFKEKIPQKIIQLEELKQRLALEKRKIKRICKTPFLIPHLLKVLELGNEYGKRGDQTFVFRYDIAHEGAKHDPQTIRLITHGTAGARKTDPTLTFPRQFEKDSKTRRINTATPIKPK